MKPIFLIGYMCSGKTTLGRAVAEAASRPFIDLDDMVEAKAGRTVGEIFASQGEAAFRALEREALAEAASAPGGAVIACGGGTPCQPGNMELMNARGITVHLDVKRADRLMGRLREGRAKRPLIAALSDTELEEFALRQLALRRPHYERAAATFDSSLLETPAEIAATAAAFIARFALTPQCH